MSYFDYLACNRELPTGYFGLPPKAVYLDYKNSSDFVIRRLPSSGEPIDMSSEDRKVWKN